MPLLDGACGIKAGSFMRWLQADTPGSPEENMAADAALLAELAEQDGPPTVRVYTWDRRAVSFGRLQPEAPVHALYPDLPRVRRPTGGRAVLHGEDLTISVAARLEHLPADSRSVLASHQLIMGAVLRALLALGLEACFGGCAVGSQTDVINCFELSAACDLIDSRTGKKLAGGAQRREGLALLQQMSLPLGLVSSRARFLRSLKSEFQRTFSHTGVIRAGIPV